MTLTKGFWLADTACTQFLWTAVLDNNPALFTDDANNPVEQVSWKDTQTFLKKLNACVSGLNARLPTEAQWEYACRAGTNTPFSFGDKITHEQVNYDSNMGKTVSVKSLPANAWGLYEMHGNVWEWCQDCYADYPTEPVTNPEGLQAGIERVVRGGSWLYYEGSVRSALRYNGSPDIRDGRLGFRFAIGL